jgi:hypothetical protein
VALGVLLQQQLLSADGDVKLTESHVISEYLDTAYPNAGPKLFPLDAKNLAKASVYFHPTSTPACEIACEIVDASYALQKDICIWTSLALMSSYVTHDLIFSILPVPPTFFQAPRVPTSTIESAHHWLSADCMME